MYFVMSRLINVGLILSRISSTVFIRSYEMDVCQIFLNNATPSYFSLARLNLLEFQIEIERDVRACVLHYFDSKEEMMQ